MGFHDHFSDASAGYAAARPTYPEARLRPAWGGDGPRTVVMPLHLLCGRHAG